MTELQRELLSVKLSGLRAFTEADVHSKYKRAIENIIFDYCEGVYHIEFSIDDLDKITDKITDRIIKLFNRDGKE